jgi:HAD superfamily hydrolase (TIGR01490 family)
VEPGPDLTMRSILAGEAAAAAAEVEAAMSPAPDSTAGAFFDVDNTVVRGASLYHLARGLYDHDFFSFRDLARFAWQQTYFRIAGTERPSHVSDARESALALIKGHRVDEITALGEVIFDEFIADRVWPGTRALAQIHLDAGQRVWLVTATPVEVARIIAARLGLSGALGTVAESVDGVYTGRLVGEVLHGPAKAVAVAALAAAEGLDLARCSAYSDSANDIPMLELVGDPWAINPDLGLRRIARERGWHVRDYRTGRRAARFGVLGAAVAGVIVGATFGAIAFARRESRRR